MLLEWWVVSVVSVVVVVWDNLVDAGKLIVESKLSRQVTPRLAKRDPFASLTAISKHSSNALS